MRLLNSYTFVAQNRESVTGLGLKQTQHDAETRYGGKQGIMFETAVHFCICVLHIIRFLKNFTRYYNNSPVKQCYSSNKFVKTKSAIYTQCNNLINIWMRNAIYKKKCMNW